MALDIGYKYFSLPYLQHTPGLKLVPFIFELYGFIARLMIKLLWIRIIFTDGSTDECYVIK